MKRSEMNETPERNGDAVNELTASTWQLNQPCFIFYCTAERVAGCGGFPGGVRWLKARLHF
jgi:hypothetical protein